MGKKRKGGISDKVRNTKKGDEKKTNPFEIKVNRQKHDILGKKIAKYDKGRPGVARSRAIKKRKETLLIEYQNRGKANKFIDKRFGEHDTKMTLEDKMLKRFALERQRTQDKPSSFNLNEEEEELTHYGQSLSRIEKFEDPVDSDEDEEESGKISGDLVADEHFGGFLTKKSDEETNKSWKERMEELIVKSKKEKYERKTEKEKTLEMTEKLDEEWKSLRLLMGGSKHKDDAPAPAKKADDYDITVRELAFEIKGKPSDRLKTEEELAKEEKERLEKLEADRLRRMKGVFPDEEAEKKQVHFSADDLDDGFILNKEDEERFHVSYKDGQLLTPFGKDQSELEDTEEEKDKDDDDDDDDDDEDGEEEENGEENSEEEESGGEDNHSDLESGDEEGGEEEEDVKEPSKQQQAKTDIVTDLKKRKKVMEEARKELPYTFPVPLTYEELVDMLEPYDADDQLTVIQRIRKCHHPSLAEGNKEKLETFFTVLLPYLGDLASQEEPMLKSINALISHLYELCQMSPIKAGQAVRDLMEEKQDEFSQYCQRKGGRGIFPKLDMVLYFKLVSLLFPTSDLKHPVVTPTMLFMGQILAKSPVQSNRDIFVGLFICTLFLEYISLSKRYVPEVINFLRGLLFLASKKDPNKLEDVVHPFKPVGKVDLLEIKGKTAKSVEIKPFTISQTFACKDLRQLSTDEFRVCATCQSLRLLQEFAVLYEDLPAYKEIFQPLRYMCSKLPTEKYPEKVQKQVSDLIQQLEKKNQNTRNSLTMQKRPPPMLKMFEPKIEESFDGRKKRGGTREFRDKQRLLHKHKKEMKSAVRELRKDSQFLARQRLEERMSRDAERKRKVKEIYGMLASQEGEFKAMKRKKDKPVI